MSFWELVLSATADEERGLKDVIAVTAVVHWQSPFDDIAADLIVFFDDDHEECPDEYRGVGLETRNLELGLVFNKRPADVDVPGAAWFKKAAKDIVDSAPAGAGGVYLYLFDDDDGDGFNYFVSSSWKSVLQPVEDGDISGNVDLANFLGDEVESYSADGMDELRGLKPLKNLTELTLMDAKVARVPAEILCQKSLDQVWFDCCEVGSYAGLAKTNVSKVIIGGVEVSAKHLKQLAGVASLRELDLRNERREKLPDGLEGLKKANLSVLSMDAYDVDEIPESIFQLADHVEVRQ